MALEERAPRLRWRRSTPGFVPGDGGVAHGDAELGQFGLDEPLPMLDWRSTCCDQCSELGRDLESAASFATLPPRIVTKPSAMPFDDGGWLDQVESVAPLRAMVSCTLSGRSPATDVLEMRPPVVTPSTNEKSPRITASPKEVVSQGRDNRDDSKNDYKATPELR